MLGIIIGVAAVIAMVTVGAGAERIAEQIRDLGTNLIVIFPGAQTSGGVRLGAGSQQTPDRGGRRAIAIEVPAVAVSAPTVRGPPRWSAATSTGPRSIQGVTPEYLDAREWDLASGRMFDPQDVDAAAKVAVLGRDGLAEPLRGQRPGRPDDPHQEACPSP